MNILALIPARMDSTRFPGKPLAKILGNPMIGHVYDRVKQCDLLTKTVVATCDDEIKEYIELIDGEEICNLLKELKLGIKTQECIDEDWFNEFS